MCACVSICASIFPAKDNRFLGFSGNHAINAECIVDACYFSEMFEIRCYNYAHGKTKSSCIANRK